MLSKVEQSHEKNILGACIQVVAIKLEANGLVYLGDGVLKDDSIYFPFSYFVRTLQKVFAKCNRQKSCV